jgi:hypothetical protein
LPASENNGHELLESNKMIEKPRDLPAGKFRTQKQDRYPSPELPRVLHELMNQLTIMNFSCSKFRAAAAHLTDHSIAIDIDKMEKTIVDMTALVESASQAMKLMSSQSPCADLLNANATTSSRSTNIYPLFKPHRRRR